MTLKERLEEGLAKMGYLKVKHPRSGLECWKAGPGRPGANSEYGFVFVGRCGGLRMGKSKSDSWSITDSGFYKQVLAKQEEGFTGQGTVADLSTLV